MHARMAAAGVSCIEGRPGARSASALGGHLEDLSRPPQEGNGAADQLSEWSDPSLSAGERQQQQQAAAGKLKKTAFKLFGGRRGICTLPSFFGGKNKSQGKGTSKKGLCKSKTHDGISDVGGEDAERGRLRSPSGGGADLPAPQLQCSQSTLLAAEAGPDGHPTSLFGSSEGFEKRSGGDRPPLPPRPKKGLKGLFHSIRRHRKSKASEPERTELQEWTSKGAAGGEEGQAATRAGADARQAPEMAAQPTRSTPARPPETRESLPDEAARGAKAGAGGDSGRLVAGGKSPDGEPAASRGSSPGVPVEAGDPPGGNPPRGGLPEDSDDDLPSAPAGDPLSLLFGDVSSLKSFDSFTGCGDIIAEPEVDSLAESAAPAGRGRDAGKRGSCLVTYQGGGEEMAVPEGVEEYLQQAWGGAVRAEGAPYGAHLPPGLTASGELWGGGRRPGVDGPRDDVDLPTPHSDQQESAPNSDEGYYDSTTPGPEEEDPGDDEGVKKDRLPRDSYSGDALYEFYDPEDPLASPAPGGEAWFDRKASPSELFGPFLDLALPPAGKDRGPRAGREGEETEEERMASIQKQLLYWEMRREPVLKHLERLGREKSPRGKECGGCQTGIARFIGRCPRCLGGEQGLDAGVSAEDRDWRDLQEMLCSQKTPGGSGGARGHGGRPARLAENGVASDSGAEPAALESYAASGSASGDPAACPFYRTHGHHGCPPGERHRGAESDGEPEQAVNFSQALVAFASSGTLFSSLSESLGSSDSGSAFTQNLPALPTMVTFDIVDVEQEGEGECEQHPGMNADEDLAASFEAFGGSCLPKETFAECDERMFPGCPPASFQNSNWGVASLPRCLRLQEMSPPGPEPPSICRRSRSLDTEGLEFELGSPPLSKNGLLPRGLRPRRGACQKGPVAPGRSAGKEDPPEPTQGRGGDGTVPRPGRQNVSYPAEAFSSQEARQWDGDLNAPAFQNSWGALEQSDAELPFTFVPQGSGKETSRRPQHDGTGDPVLELPRPMARPSNLPLRTPAESQEVTAGPRGQGRDRVGRKLARVLPLGEKSADPPPGFGCPRPPGEPATRQPVNVTEGGPPRHCGGADAFESEDCGSSEVGLPKGRAACWDAPSASCQNNVTVNVTVAE